MSQTALLSGSKLCEGVYTVKNVISRDGFSVLYRAQSIKSGATVAIREFYPVDLCVRDTDNGHLKARFEDIGLFTTIREKFARESEMISRLDHPNIIKVYDTFEQNNTAYSVMDYIEGDLLSDIVIEDGRLKIGDATRYIEKIGAGLDYLHKYRIGNLIFTPESVVVRSVDNMPVIIDIGIVKRYAATMIPKEKMNESDSFNVPHGKTALFDPKADVFTLVAMFCYMIVGAQAVVWGRFPDVFEIRFARDLYDSPTIPISLVSTLNKALSEKNTESVKDFLEAIKFDLTSAKVDLAHKKTQETEEPIEMSLAPKPVRKAPPVFNHPLPNKFGNKSKVVEKIDEEEEDYGDEVKKATPWRWVVTIVILIALAMAALFISTSLENDKLNHPMDSQRPKHKSTTVRPVYD